MEEVEIQLINISKIKVNPKNPRIIRDEKFKKLVKSIKDFPEMLNIRPIVLNKDMMILGGNMRFKAFKEAMKDSEQKEIPAIIVDLSPEKQDEFIIKDNVSGGEWDWDILANEWDSNKLDEWGLEVATLENGEELDDKYSQNVGEVVYEPKNTDWKETDLFVEEEKFDQEIELIQNPLLQRMFKLRKAIFTKFDFSKIADYYAYQATEEEKKMFEKLALVLLDKDQLIENGFSKILDSITEPYEEN